MTELRTERLLLRQWRDDDKLAFAALNADPAVMEHFPAPLSRAESDSFVDRMRDRLADHGWGLWAVERLDDGALLGFTGLAHFAEGFPFAPATEVGWRLARQFWGYGYATEAAHAALDYAFSVLALDEVVSMTASGNVRSQRVMQRLGMTRDPAEDFDHPRVPDGHPTRRHVLHRLRRDDYAG